MDIRAVDTTPLNWTGDALAVGLYEGTQEVTGDLAQLDGRLSGTLQELITEYEFEGKTGTTAVTRVGGGSPIRKIILVGLGKAEDLKLDTFRRAAASISRIAKQEKVKRWVSVYRWCRITLP